MEKAIESLEQQVAQLSKLCSDLHAENNTVKNEQRIAEKEVEQLREKNRIARGRVEQIVDRLKSIET
ncbi:MAG: hypothetical protein ACI810_001413 [Gammaproteobacteria bacterium]|jgi:uncharacterized protein (TIGR02449 family)